MLRGVCQTIKIRLHQCNLKEKTLMALQCTKAFARDCDGAQKVNTQIKG